MKKILILPILTVLVFALSYNSAYASTQLTGTATSCTSYYSCTFIVHDSAGTAQIGVFNSDLSVKKLFSTIDVSTINTTPTDYEFKLPISDPLYTVSSGDRIGIKYTGGNSTVGVNVTPDRDPADPFDGINSYRVRYESSWITSSADDMYMILKQTHAPSFPITYMSDTTVSFASLVSAPRQILAEYVTPTSSLVGKPIDSITLQLQKVGTANGTAQVGVFNSDLSVKKLFSTIDVSTISTTPADYEFKLPVSDPLYTIASGDRIGIMYTGGSATVGINVTPDRDPADPFDGINSYRVRYESSWIVSNGEDMYMILKQTHAASSFPVIHMSDTTTSFASLLSAPRQILAEYVTPTSSLVGKPIDSITLQLQKVGAPPPGTGSVTTTPSSISFQLPGELKATYWPAYITQVISGSGNTYTVSSTFSATDANTGKLVNGSTNTIITVTKHCGYKGCTTKYTLVSGTITVLETDMLPPPFTAPQNSQASAGDDAIVLTWTPPASTGGLPITEYKIYRSTSSGTETYYALRGNVLSYIDTQVTSGVTYFYKVSAVNYNGESPLSNEASNCLC